MNGSEFERSFPNYPLPISQMLVYVLTFQSELHHLE